MNRAETLPRPRLTLRVGITGHRMNRLAAADLDRLRETLSGVLAEVGAGVARFAATPDAALYDGASPALRIVSPLAEGADRLAAEAAPAGWALTVLLPMPRAEYERDFLSPGEDTSPSLEMFRALLARADTVTELPSLDADLSDPGRRAAQYGALGRFLIGNVDLLIAVWDGEAAAGPGGTAVVVAEAAARGVPTIRVAPDGSGLAIVLPPAREDAPASGARPPDGATMNGLLRAILGFGDAPLPAETLASANPAGEGHRTGPAPAPAGPPAYLREGWPTSLRLAVGYTALRALAGAGRWSWPLAYAPISERLGDWEPFFTAVAPEEGGGLGGANLADLRTVLLPRSVWADALAWSHGHLYRSAYVTVFTLAGLAVPLGLLYLFADGSPSILDIKAGFVFAELLIISAVAAIVWRGNRQRWHRSWMETRELAELLRVARPLACLGRAADLLPVAAPPGRPGQTFPLWYVRATLRELRPIAGLLDAAYLRRILTGTLETEIREQRAYHGANAAALSRIDHALHRWGMRCLTATIGVLVLYLALWAADAAVTPAHAAGGEARNAASWLHAVLHDVVKPLVSVLAAGLPALGAALAGIRAQGEFAERAQHSAVTSAELAGVEAEIRRALDGPPRELTPERAGDLLLRAAHAMVDDVQSWRQVYLGKDLVLPA